jgi:hypothetical protein
LGRGASPTIRAPTLDLRTGQRGQLWGQLIDHEPLKPFIINNL